MWNIKNPQGTERQTGNMNWTLKDSWDGKFYHVYFTIKTWKQMITVHYSWEQLQKCPQVPLLFLQALKLFKHRVTQAPLGEPRGEHSSTWTRFMEPIQKHRDALYQPEKEHFHRDHSGYEWGLMWSGSATDPGDRALGSPPDLDPPALLLHSLPRCCLSGLPTGSVPTGPCTWLWSWAQPKGWAGVRPLRISCQISWISRPYGPL